MEEWDDILSTMQWPSLPTRIVTPRDTTSLPDDKRDNNVIVTRSPRQKVKPDSIGLVSVSKAPEFTVYVRKLDQKIVAQSELGLKPCGRHTVKSKDFKVIFCNGNGYALFF